MEEIPQHVLDVYLTIFKNKTKSAISTIKKNLSWSLCFPDLPSWLTYPGIFIFHLGLEGHLCPTSQLASREQTAPVV